MTPLLLATLPALVSLGPASSILSAGAAPSPTASPSERASPEAAPRATPDATTLLNESRQTLLDLPSMSAEIIERADFDGRRFEARGTYLAGAFPKLRLELTVELEGLRGHLLEVCDGQVLWSIREISDPTIEKATETDPASLADVTETSDRQIIRRDVDRILAALRRSSVNPQQLLDAEIGLGGLPALLAGLESAFELAVQDRPSQPDQMVLAGPWRDGVLEKLQIDRKRSRRSLPDMVEVTLDRRTRLPVRVTYLQARDGAPRKLMQIELRQIRTAVAIGPERFQYTPPSDITVQDATSQTLRAIGDEE